jgi:Leucine-rich repeat (LRR) protein
MRYVLFLSTLALFFGGSFNLMTGEETVSPSVQESIDRIKSMKGQYKLTPENTLKEITFADSSGLDASAFDMFAKQSDLEVLQIANYRDLNDVDVAKLTGLKKLKNLRLTNGSITDAAIKTIAASFPDLTALDVSSNTRLTDAATEEIAKLQKLERLDLLFCDFSEFGILNIAALPKLKALDIRANMQVGDGGMGALAMLPSLRSLQHRSTAVTDSGLQALAAAKVLDNLGIYDFQITGQSGQYLRQMEKLTSLIIFRCESFDSSGLLELKGLKLNRLTLRGLPVDDVGMEVFRDLPTMKRLYLHELPSVSDVGMLNLAYLKDLEVLDIWEMPIGDKSVETITKLTSLKNLTLRSTNISDVGLELLLTLPKLESLKLEGNAKVTPEMIQKLKDAKKFKVE